MRLKAPKINTFWIAIGIGAVGVVAYLLPIPYLSGIATWLIIVGFVLLILGNLIKGL